MNFRNCYAFFPTHSQQQKPSWFVAGSYKPYSPLHLSSFFDDTSDTEWRTDFMAKPSPKSANQGFHFITLEPSSLI